MNRRGFFASLITLPAALKALAAVKPEEPSKYLAGDGKWWEKYASTEQFTPEQIEASWEYSWKSLHAPIIYCDGEVKWAGEVVNL